MRQHSIDDFSQVKHANIKRFYELHNELRKLRKQREQDMRKDMALGYDQTRYSQSFIEAAKNIIAGADVKAELDKMVKKIDQDIEDNQGYPMPE